MTKTGTIMGHQSEVEFETSLIKTLSNKGYERVTIPDIVAMEANFKKQIIKRNNVLLSDIEFQRILTHLDGGTIFEKAKGLLS